MKLEQDDLDAIAGAVIAGLKAEGLVAAASAPAASTGNKPAGKGKDKTTESAPKEPTEDEIKKARAALLEKL